MKPSCSVLLNWHKLTSFSLQENNPSEKNEAPFIRDNMTLLYIIGLRIKIITTLYLMASILMLGNVYV